MDHATVTASGGPGAEGAGILSAASAASTLVVSDSKITVLNATSDNNGLDMTKTTLTLRNSTVNANVDPGDPDTITPGVFIYDLALRDAVSTATVTGSNLAQNVSAGVGQIHIVGSELHTKPTAAAGNLACAASFQTGIIGFLTSACQ